MSALTKDKRALPNYDQLLETIGAKPRTGQLLLAPGWRRYSLMSEKKQKSMGAIAILLGTTRVNVRKALLLGPDPNGDAVRKVAWRRGRKNKKFALSSVEFGWLDS